MSLILHTKIILKKNVSFGLSDTVLTRQNEPYHIDSNNRSEQEQATCWKHFLHCTNCLWGTSLHKFMAFFSLITGRNEVLAKVMFLQVSVILSTGGGGLARKPPPAGWRTPPVWMENAPRLEGEPPRLDGEPPPAGWRTPPAGWRTPPAGRRTPPAGWRKPPPRGGEADSGIRSTIGRYASYWNAFLFKL